MPCSHGYRLGGGWYCDKHKVQFNNQNYCELCLQEQITITNEEIERETTRLLDESNRFLSGLYKAKEQTKMTRDEATKILQTCKYSLIDTLEALGLLKFDEPSKPEMIEWHCEGIVHRYPKGYDPNHSSGLIWIKVAEQELITIPLITAMGTHTHEVALQTIIKALNAKGYETIKSDKIYRIDYKDGTRIIYDY